MASGREIVGLPYNYKQFVYTIVQSGVIGIQVSRLRLFWFLGGSIWDFHFWEVGLGGWDTLLGFSFLGFRLGGRDIHFFINISVRSIRNNSFFLGTMG